MFTLTASQPNHVFAHRSRRQLPCGIMLPDSVIPVKSRLCCSTRDHCWLLCLCTCMPCHDTDKALPPSQAPGCIVSAAISHPILGRLVVRATKPALMGATVRDAPHCTSKIHETGSGQCPEHSSLLLGSHMKAASSQAGLAVDWRTPSEQCLCSIARSPLLCTADEICA